MRETSFRESLVDVSGVRIVREIESNKLAALISVLSCVGTEMADHGQAPIFLSAGEASGDLYASLLAEALLRRRPDLSFYGCAGPRMRAVGVRAIVRSESLAVVGLVEVLRHIPRIYGEFRKLIAATEKAPPAVAILTDSPDFHLRVARKLAARRIPVIYYIAPQVWAWRKDRLPLMRRVIGRLLCIFPFEQEFFEQHGIRARFIGHPLVGRIQPRSSREQFFREQGLDPGLPLVALLPGSRRGEAARHLPELLAAVRLLSAGRRLQFVLPASATTGKAFFEDIFRERKPAPSIQVIEGQSWDAIAYSELALAASGTVTVECALLGTPLITYYKVNRVSWMLGKLLVRVPYYSMVNLIAGRPVIGELMQDDFTGVNLARAARRLLDDSAARTRMVQELATVSAQLAGAGDAIESAADEVMRMLEEHVTTS